MIIDTHAHFVPQSMLDQVVSGRERFSSIEVLREDKSYRLAFCGGVRHARSCPG